MYKIKILCSIKCLQYIWCVILTVSKKINKETVNNNNNWMILSNNFDSNLGVWVNALVKGGLKLFLKFTETESISRI